MKLLRSVALVVSAMALAACDGGGRKARCELPFSGDGDVRVFAVVHRFTLDDAETYGSFRRSWRRHLGEIEPCLANDRPNLIVFPEDAGLLAWFLGTRGSDARQQTDSEVAFYNIYGQWSGAAQFYLDRDPSISAARALTLALGDPARRAMDETFGGIALETGAWVITGANLPYATRTTDPALVALLADPDLDGGDGAWVADDSEVYNTALLYGPDGALAGRVDKVYLTDPEEQILDLSRARLDRMPLLETPFAKIGVAISRDAFYAPFTQRLETLGTEIFAQPEAWSGWTIEEMPGVWEPDAILASGWSANQKYRGIVATVAPMLAGNLFDQAFDGQPWVTVKASPDDAPSGFVGSLESTGWRSIGPWAHPDPGIDDPSLSLEERRALLREQGEALLAGSGDPDEGRYADAVIGADLALRRDSIAVESAANQSAAVAPAESGDQSSPTAAYDAGGRLYAAWTDTRSGTARIRFATSDDAGATWSASVEVDGTGTAAQRLPSIAAGASGRVALAWQEDGESDRVRVATSLDGGTSFAPAVDVEAVTATQWMPSIAFQGTSLRLAVAWCDFREGAWAPKVRASVSTDGGISWAQSLRVDPSNAETSRPEGSQVQPSLAFGPAGPAIAWIDYRARDWSVWAAIGTGGVFAFGAAAPVSPSGNGVEVLASDPSVLATGDEVSVVWEEVRARRGHADVRSATIPSGGGAWILDPVIPGGAETGAFASRFRPSIAATASGRVVVFQDTGPSKPALSFSSLDGDPTPARADDSGTAAVSQSRPRLAARPDGGGAVVLFEDDRDGSTRIRARRLP